MAFDAKRARSNLLVIDDERTLRDLARALFEPTGLTVFTTAGGTDALEVVARESIGVAIVDKNLGGELSGMDVLRALQTVSPSTRAIIVTAYSSTESAIDALRLRAFDYIAKPFEIEVLEEKVEAAFATLTVETERAALVDKLERQVRHAQKMDAIGRFAGGIAHDFNTVLSVVIANSEIMRHKLGDYPELQGDLNGIFEAAQRGSRLTRQLLAFSRSETTKPEMLHLGTLVSQMTEMLHRLVGEDIEIEIEHDADLGAISADRSQMEQIVLNLAANARDALPDGGTLRVHTSNITVDETLSSSRPGLTPGQYVMLAMSDDGEGMSPEVREQIFEPTFTTKENGTGLGLATVNDIVAEHGGHVGVYSQRQVGTTVCVYLPRVGDAPSEPDDVDMETFRGDATVLLVEDNDVVRRVAKHALEAVGFTVTVATNADSALEAYDASPTLPDVLVTDIIMPGSSGAKLARTLRSRQANLRIVYTSGYSGPASQENEMLSGASLFLPKPFASVDLVSAVSEVLKKPVD